MPPTYGCRRGLCAPSRPCLTDVLYYYSIRLSTQITHTRHGERNPPRLKLVFCCRARADLFGRLGHDALQPAVERQPALPPEPARLLELGEIWGDVGDIGIYGEIWEDMGRYGLASLVELGLLGERVVA